MITKTGTWLVKASSIDEEQLRLLMEASSSGDFENGYVIGNVPSRAFRGLQKMRVTNKDGKPYPFKVPKLYVPPKGVEHIKEKRLDWDKYHPDKVHEMLRNLLTNPEVKAVLSRHEARPSGMLVAPSTLSIRNVDVMSVYPDENGMVNFTTVYDPPSADLHTRILAPKKKQK